MGGHLFPLSISFRPSLNKFLTASAYNSIKVYIYVLSTPTLIKKRFVCFGLGIRQRSLILIRCVLVWCFQSYSQTSKENGHADELIEERAPSTAEEFKKMAEEKLRDAQQGVASQTAEKVYDATEEATLGDSDDLQSVKRRYEEHEEGADYRRKSGDQSDGVKALSNKA